MFSNKSVLERWLDYINSLSPIEIDLTLDRVRLVANVLDLLPLKVYTILIGGTNGKGTTCCLLENILLNSKMRVGLYTSPHLLSYKERIRICGKELPDCIHIKAMSIVEKARGNIILTYFEFITLSAFYIFKQFALDVVILEVGLGGRLDATNVIDPDISVITNIALDHVDFLGETRDSIALEKSGIFRLCKPAVIGEIVFPDVISDISKSKGSILFSRGRDWDFYCYNDKWVWFGGYHCCKTLYDLPLPMIPIENAAIVLSILYWLPFPIFRRAICYGLRCANLEGRFQIVHYDPLIILDVGHNSHAASYIIRRLYMMIENIQSIRLVIGMLKNKDVKDTVSYFRKLVNVWYCSNLDTPLSTNFEKLFGDSNNFSTKYFYNIQDAWRQAIVDSNRNDCILVFGSFHAVRPIMKLILSDKIYC